MQQSLWTRTEATVFFSYAAENDQSGKGRRPFSDNSLPNWQLVRGDVIVVISWIPDN